VNTFVTNINRFTNTIGAEGAATLTDALQVNIFMTTVNLGQNQISNEGASALADALKGNDHLSWQCKQRIKLRQSQLVGCSQQAFSFVVPL
jgi:hypothetical protein